MTNGAHSRRIWLASFAAPGWEDSQATLVRSARELGEFSGTIEWTIARFRQARPFHVSPHFEASLGNETLGLWRPLVILDELRKLPDGDVVVYHDAGQGYWGDHTFRASIAPVIEWTVDCNGGMLPGVWLPEDGRNARWTTRRCFRVMDCDTERFWSTPQVQAIYSVWQRNERTMAFVESWLSACLEVHGDPPPHEVRRENFEDFAEDRGAQSILTNLVIRAGGSCFGRAHETTSAVTHPAHSRIPASDIGNLCARIAQERSVRTAIASRSEAATDPHCRPALFTSIPPRLDRRSVDGFAIGEEYQAECIASWRRCGFDIYSVHYRDELTTLRRHEGVTYVEAERWEDDDPDEMKPSLRSILSAVKRSGADVPGIVNSDILLLNPPGWVEVIQREIADSVIVVTRYETNDIDRTCVGWAPWGFDVLFFDPAYIDRLEYCGMRMGESWWDYWLPLSLYFEGATLKHVEDCIALHHDHPIVSSKKIHEFGQRFLLALTRTAEAETLRGQTSRRTRFYDYCRYRFPLEAARTGLPAADSTMSLANVMNPTVWAGICAITRNNRLEVVAKRDPHHRLLADLTLRTAQRATQQRTDYSAGNDHGSLANHPAVVYSRELSQTWSYRLDTWVGNLARRIRGRPQKSLPRIETVGDAIAFVRQLDARVIWSLAGFFRWVHNLVCRRRQNLTRRRRAAAENTAVAPELAPLVGKAVGDRIEPSREARRNRANYFH
jgi:hypothetical protein